MDLIIGIGNPLRRDDGFGAAVVERIELKEPLLRVRLLCVHQLTPEIAEDLAAVNRVLFVDARMPAGVHDRALVLELLPIDTPETDALTHGVGPAGLLRFTRDVYGVAPAAWTLSAPAHDLETGEGLSAPCAVLLPEAIQRIEDWVRTRP